MKTLIKQLVREAVRNILSEQYREPAPKPKKEVLSLFPYMRNKLTQEGIDTFDINDLMDLFGNQEEKNYHAKVLQMWINNGEVSLEFVASKNGKTIWSGTVEEFEQVRSGKSLKDKFTRRKLKDVPIKVLVHIEPPLRKRLEDDQKVRDSYKIAKSKPGFKFDKMFDTFYGGDDD